MGAYQFIDSYGSFCLENAENDQELYFPLAGENGLKSAVTPNLGGDAKLDQNHFLLEPVSVSNLHNNKSTRNFWVKIDDEIWSATGASARQEADRGTAQQEQSKVQAGFMWYKTSRENHLGISAEICQFIPVQQNVEIMQVTLKNHGEKARCIQPTAAIPLYGRSADNIRDHRHVTSLLHRMRLHKLGIEVTPTLSFDERGHQENDTSYYVAGMEGDGIPPVGFFPEVSSFIGKSGSFMKPAAVYTNEVQPWVYEADKDVELNGQEIVGALRFAERVLAPGESIIYTVFLGACKANQSMETELEALLSQNSIQAEYARTIQYWRNKVNVKYHTGDENFDRFMDWVSFQPDLRRVFGCSFLPHHDYGKGGRGWRDLWQDCLALLVMNPAGVRQMLISNYGGVRMDGSNATIIGEHLGEFKADRNSITRVWMDHGVWPMVTTKFYLDQTGDFNLLYQEVPYFKDRQVSRGQAVDPLWEGEKWQQDSRGKEYRGTILEHLLVQNLTAFYEVGAHNHIRLRDADWNDALDMASKEGESVAFTNAYAMNLETLAEVLELEKAKGVTEIQVLSEIEMLMNCPTEHYEDKERKLTLLNGYMDSCQHTISGQRVAVNTQHVIEDLKGKAAWLKQHIRKTEWVTDQQGDGWFNGYYDNHGQRVEGEQPDGSVRMMLTGQVFSIMAGTADDAQVQSITKTCDKYLYDEDCGGYRLNTDFHEIKTDMGRMFGFAYGEKENGAVFSHMAVMYANALYRRGFVKEGFKSLKALHRQSMNFEKSRIYPGIPEYFGRDGRGLYHYLTGAASWYMMTVVTQMFGARGEAGSFVVAPKLLAEQFDADGKAQISLKFAGHCWQITIENPEGLEYGEYKIGDAKLSDNMQGTLDAAGAKLVIDQKQIQKMDEHTTCKIYLVLTKKGD